MEGCYSLAKCIGEEWKIPAPETCEAIRKAATTAGTLMNRRNWSIESMNVVPKVLQARIQFAPCAVR
jgi:hypothetical protein